ncbi:nucleoside triphosphate pyrophosphohydrolase family protein [Terrisporobacter petrolearius]|uniref:nucleoside triphosphate pyrophosphohydrolase family protein n=1 Tax=Terrisporobacter petrolearius TaxID=1460447 RepID=UPI001D16F32A|nr:nucleoside triphosphate pyrophosphohydrolase family protein [Terrisporobacter petrolearius]MCC3864089.1 nucleoside triphosphate pyrophosphohydrolase family protein [Terrisporobacter petrolearius]
MKINEYQELAKRTINKDLNEKDMLINGVMGLCGESGEAIDIVKKHIAHNHKLDKDHLAKELGDVAWYLAETATALGYSLEDIFKMNIDKLKKRYPEGFDSEKSIHRRDDDI